jgi:hypothetical protein
MQPDDKIMVIANLAKNCGLRTGIWFMHLQMAYNVDQNKEVMKISMSRIELLTAEKDAKSALGFNQISCSAFGNNATVAAALDDADQAESEVQQQQNVQSAQMWNEMGTLGASVP